MRLLLSLETYLHRVAPLQLIKHDLRYPVPRVTEVAFLMP